MIRYAISLVFGSKAFWLGAAVVVGWLYLQTLYARISDLQIERDTAREERDHAKADLATSTANARRMIEERDRLSVSLQDMAEAERRRIAQSAQLTEELSHVEDPGVCADSPPVRLVLERLRQRVGPAPAR